MEVFATRDQAIEVARRIMDDPGRTEVEVGPMLDPKAGNVLEEDQLRRLFAGRQAAGSTGKPPGQVARADK